MKIKQISTEPEIIYTGSSFLLKVKVQDGMTYDEAKELTWTELMSYTYEELKGE